MEQNASVFLANDEQSLSGTSTYPKKLSRRMYGTTHRFQEEDAAIGTSSAPFDPGRSNRQFLSYKHHRYEKRRYENTPA